LSPCSDFANSIQWFFEPDETSLWRAVLRLLQDGDVYPQLVVLAVARVAGELGAGIAQAGDMDLEAILADVTEVVRKAGHTHHELLQAEELPVAGNA
jgi:hypothetical protein